VTLWLLAALPALAQDEGEERLRIDLRVSASGPGAVVVVDRGQADGLAQGDEVVFRPREGGIFRGSITRLDERTATVELFDPAFVPVPGTRGEVFVPRSRVLPPAPAPLPQPPVEGAPPEQATPPEGAAGAEGQAAAPPPHPDWKNQDEEWTSEMPLLSRVKPVRPEERARLYTGRLTFFADGTWNTEDDRSDTQLRTGADLSVENPFGQGGELQVGAEFDHFVFDVPDDDDDETVLRLDRLSYALGGTRFAPNRFEGGRFLQHGMPEFGFLDGVEWTHRRDNGHSYGASIGYMPELDLDFETGDDLQVAGFYEWVFDGASDLSLAAGAQKTWHEGEPDRDLVVARLDYLPPDSWDLRAATWVDLYDADDDGKGNAEITQALVSTSRLYGRDGFTFTYRHLAFPELLREEEFTESIFEDLSAAHYDRLSLSAYHETPGDSRLRGSVGVWNDEDESGGDCEIGAEVPGVFVDAGRAGIALFAVDAAFSVDAGLRLNYGLADDAGRWDFYYVYADRHENDFSHESDDLWEHTLRASRAFYMNDGWYMSTEAETRYFDDELAFSLTLFLQKTF
jgi:hypothetical protein